MRKSRSDKIFDVFNVVFMALIIFIMLYPIYFTVIASFSDPYEVAKGNITFLPKKITFDAYINVFRNSDIWIGYRNTTIYTILGTCLNLFLTIPAAYGLSKKKLPGKTFISWYFLFTMYFSGGLIPTYLLVRNLGLYNQPFTLIVLQGLNVFNLIVTRIFFATTIPEPLYEAARIDGSSELRSFFTIALPLAAPIIAVMALFYGVTRWNDYMTALIYLSDKEFFPLQLILRGILIQNQNALATIDQMDASTVKAAVNIAYMAEAMKYSLIFIASAPLLAVYPFVQKYFVKGVMIGSLKG